jgi:diguanylate cyclase (GGDEF)-like protein
VAVGLLVFAVGTYTPRAVVESAVEDATLKGVETAKQMKILRAFYSEHVIPRATAAGTAASPFYKTEPAIPVPTTFILDVAEAFSTDDLSVRLVSPFPWPSRGGRMMDDFQQEAWDYLSLNPDESFARRVEANGREVLRVAVGDAMSSSCVDCHNSSPRSPKRDWEIGQIRGLIEVTRPLDAVTAGASDLSWKLVQGIIVAGTLLLFALLANGLRLIRPLRDLTRVINRIAKGPFQGEVPHLSRRDEIGTVARALLELQEQTGERARAEAQISHMAHHDALTGLPNRLQFREETVKALRAARGDEKLAVLCLDLDHFKAVNDTLGHPVGDSLLQAVGERLKGCLRAGDIVARLGGDEFAIVQSSTDQPVAATALAERIIGAVEDVYEIDGHQVVVGVSVGIAISPDDGDDPDQLLKSADMALYRSKSDGRGIYRFFEPEMDAKMQARRAMELDLRKALVNNEFEVHYQPLVNLEQNIVCGFEALLRWHHPTKGTIPPNDFIPLAEEIGAIGAIGAWVLKQACREAKSWPPAIKVAVNLSPAQFKSRTLVLDVISALGDSGLAPQRLELEITETVMLQDTDATLETLHQLRELGVRISMDDFGTGYSSLSYLRKFPFDKIKIDQSFIRELSDSDESMAIIRAVTGLGLSFGMSTTAEGVETKEQLRRLRDEGCTEVQGYLLSPPKPAAEVAGMLRKIKRNLRRRAA